MNTIVDHQRFSDMEEDRVVVLAQTDGTAAEYLLDKYKNMVRARARGYFLIGGDREDIIQEGMIGLFRAIKDFKPGGAPFCAFADLCVTRQILSAVKSATRQKHEPLNHYVSMEGPAYEGGSLWEQHTDPMEIIMGQESFRQISRALLDRLSELEKQVLALYLQGLSYGEIAQHIGRPEKSVDNALQRIKAKLITMTDS